MKNLVKVAVVSAGICALATTKIIYDLKKQRNDFQQVGGVLADILDARNEEDEKFFKRMVEFFGQEKTDEFMGGVL